MDDNLLDLEGAFGVSPGMSKAELLLTGQSAMTHAMLFTAVHVDDKGKPVRYRVENSWGEAAGPNKVRHSLSVPFLCVCVDIDQ